MTETAINLAATDEHEALADLIRGALDRLQAAAWEARAACGRINHDQGSAALQAIDDVQHALEKARRHATAVAAYQKAYQAVAKAGR